MCEICGKINKEWCAKYRQKWCSWCYNECPRCNQAEHTLEIKIAEDIETREKLG